MKPKERAGGSGTPRKPPVPAEGHAVIEEWIRGVMPSVHPIVARLDELICETIPDLQYALKWQKAYYGLPGLGWVIELAAYHVSANIVFHGGQQLDPPPPLGTGRSRYVKLTTLEETGDPQLHAWIEQAGRVPGWQ